MDTLRAALNVLEAQERADAARARDEGEDAARRKREPQAARQREAMLLRPAGAAAVAGGTLPAGPPAVAG